MAGSMSLSVDQSAFRAVAAAMKAEADGKDLRSALIRDLKAPAAPLVRELKESIESAPSHGAFLGEPLRQGVADQIRPVVRLSGRDTGVQIKAKKTPGIRGFNNAAKAMNSPSWRHQVFGRGWAQQTSKPMWFDGVTARHREEFHRAAMAAVHEMAERLAARSRGH